jgi:hypothetical protein
MGVGILVGIVHGIFFMISQCCIDVFLLILWAIWKHNFDFQCLELLTHLSFISFQLVEQDSEGQCNSECKTIERACQEVRFCHLICILFDVLVWLLLWNSIMAKKSTELLGFQILPSKSKRNVQQSLNFLYSSTSWRFSIIFGPYILFY